MSRHAIPYITGDDQTLSPPHTPFLPFTLLPPRITQPTTQPTNPNQNATKPLPFNYPIYLPSIAPQKCHPYPPRPADSLQSKPRARSQEPRAERNKNRHLSHLFIYPSIYPCICHGVLSTYLSTYTYKYTYIYLSIHIARFNSLHFTSLHFNSIQSNPLQPTSLQPNPTQSTPLPSTLPYTTLQSTHHTTPLFPPRFPPISQSPNPPACIPGAGGDEIGISFSLLLEWSEGVGWMDGMEWKGRGLRGGGFN